MRMITNDSSDQDRKISAVSQQLHDLISKAACSAVNSLATHPVHAMVLCGAAATGALHQLAQAVSPEDRDRDGRISSTATLFAALLAYRMSPCQVDPGSIESEFSPLVVVDALKDFEKLTGQQPDEQLNAQMCIVSRKVATDPEAIRRIEQEKARMRMAHSSAHSGNLH